MNKSKLVLVAGTPCSGKTTISKKVIRNHNMFYIDKDVIQDCFTRERDGDYYKRIKNRTYCAMYELAKSNLDLNNNVLIDAPHVRQLQDPEWIDYMTSLSNDIRVVWCYAEENDLKDRIKKRGYGRDSWKLSNWEKYMEMEPRLVGIPLPNIEINTSNSYKMKDLEEFLR